MGLFEDLEKPPEPEVDEIPDSIFEDEDENEEDEEEEDED